MSSVLVRLAALIVLLSLTAWPERPAWVIGIFPMNDDVGHEQTGLRLGFSTSLGKFREIHVTLRGSPGCEGHVSLGYACLERHAGELAGRPESRLFAEFRRSPVTPGQTREHEASILCARCAERGPPVPYVPPEFEAGYRVYYYYRDAGLGALLNGAIETDDVREW